MIEPRDANNRRAGEPSNKSESLTDGQWQYLTIEKRRRILMAVGMRYSVRAAALACAVLAGYDQAHGQTPVNHQEYPSTGFPPWTPSVGIPPLPKKRKVDTDWMLLKASKALQEDGRDAEAITVLNMVFASKYEPQVLDSCQHAACIQLSETYERRGELARALEFAILARDKYKYHDWCGVMVMSIRASVDERIAALSERLDGAATHPSPR